MLKAKRQHYMLLRRMLPKKVIKLLHSRWAVLGAGSQLRAGWDSHEQGLLC